MTVLFFSQASHEGTTTAGVAYDLPAHVSATAATAVVVVVRPPLIGGYRAPPSHINAPDARTTAGACHVTSATTAPGHRNNHTDTAKIAAATARR